MIELKALVRYCDELLCVDQFRDYAPNGLQVEGEAIVNKIVAGVTASQALIDAAIDERADILLVHHGFFWKGESPCLTGFKRNRIAALLKNNISLVAYHLPLDGHESLGNNAQLASLLGLSVTGRFGRERGDDLAMYGVLPRPYTPQELSELLSDKLARKPLHLAGRSTSIKTVGWCSGAAQSYIEAAAELGLDAFLSGEVSENTTHLARELGVHYFAAGHHATERYGVKALAEHLGNKFDVKYAFVDIDNAV